MTKQLRLILICLLTLPVHLWAQEKWDLKKAVDYAITNNISVRQADLQARFSQLQIQQNRLSQYPNANLQGNVGYRFGLSENPTTGVLENNSFLSSGYQLGTNVTLFNWFARKYNTAASSLAYEADKAGVRKVQDDIALNVAIAYLQVLLAREQANVSAVQVQQTSGQLQLTRKQVAAGALPELNAAQLEAQLARDSSSLVTAQATAQQNLLQLKAILNLDAAAPFDIAAPSVQAIPVENLADLQPESVYQQAVVNLTQQKVNALRLQSAEQNVKAARSGMYPTISAYGNLGTNYVNIAIPQFAFGPQSPTGAKVVIGATAYDVLAPGRVITGEKTIPYFSQLRNNFGQNVGLAFNVPIFNGGQQRIAWQRSKLEVQRQQLLVESDNQRLKQDIYKAYTDAVTALQRYNAFQKSVAAAEKAYNFAQKRYDLNLLSGFDLINSQNNLLQSRIEMLSAQFDYVFRMKLLEFYKGQGLKL